MLKRIQESRKYIAIAGFRGTKIANVDRFCKKVKTLKPAGVEAQFFDARKIATWQHLYFSALNALTSFENKTNVSRSLAMEIMHFASAQRQIREAVSKIGISSESAEVAVAIVGARQKAIEKTLAMISRLLGGKRDDAVLELTPEKIREIREAFDISPEEFGAVGSGKESEQALVDLILERVALVSTLR
jgi:tRNA threonylcarbamoyladenosine modification (KEOPS) complex Cgi121 subunit